MLLTGVLNFELVSVCSCCAYDVPRETRRPFPLKTWGASITSSVLCSAKSSWKISKDNNYNNNSCDYYSGKVPNQWQLPLFT